MLRSCTLIAVLVGLAVVAAGARKGEFYSDKYDNIDIEGILENDRTREQYLKCFMDEGPCVTPDAVFFKALMPEALATNCRKCTEKGKQNIERTVLWFMDKRPGDFIALLTKMVEKARAKHPNAKIDIPPLIPGSV